jgi:hypothetical protein
LDGSIGFRQQFPTGADALPDQNIEERTIRDHGDRCERSKLHHAGATARAAAPIIELLSKVL